MADDNDIKKSTLSFNPLQDALSSNDPSAMGAMSIARSAIKKGTSNIEGFKEISKPVSSSTVNKTIGLTGTGAGYFAGRMDEKNSSDNNTKPEPKINVPSDEESALSHLKVGGQFHTEETKKHVAQSRMDDYHEARMHKELKGTSTEEHMAKESQPFKRSSREDGGDHHIVKGHDYIKDLL